MVIGPGSALEVISLQPSPGQFLFHLPPGTIRMQYNNNLSGWSLSLIATVLASLSSFLSSWGTYDKLTDNVSLLFDNAGEEFDFIIVGGGSAGGVLAYRLSTNHRVLLLEAGGGLNPFQAIPAMSLLLLNYRQIDWKHKTVPQAHSCFALPNNESHWSQGLGLGGTSNLNFLIQSRGNPRDFDNWAKITGDKSWSYEELLPYFKVSEDYHGPWDNPKTKGKGGPLPITIPEYTGMAEDYVRAGGELGYPRADLNGYYTEGFDTIFYPIKSGRRHGVHASYLEPAIANNPLLTIRKYAYVKRVLIDDKNKAYGVEYDHHGRPLTALASKEVILSAGAMNSPKILLLSGVGPKGQLLKHGINLRSDLPVGENLQDHISTYLGPFFINKSSLFSIDRDVSVPTIAEYFTTGRGILTTSGTQAMGFFSSSLAKKAGEKDWPDIQLILAGVTLGNRFGAELARGFGPKEELMLKYYAHAEGRESFLQIVSLGRPHAVGTIELGSNDPYGPPIIDPNYLSNAHDIKVMVEAIQKAVSLIEDTETFKRFNGSFTTVPFPGCEKPKFKSAAYYECYARHLSLTLHHIVGSCSIGRVVDNELRVKGIRGLRVIDASVMPQVPVGNTNSPTIMIAEKGAHMLLKKWNVPPPPTTLPPPTVPTSPTPPPTTPTTTATTTKPTTTTEEESEEEEEEEEFPRRRVA